MDSVIRPKRQPKPEDMNIFENILNNSTIHEAHSYNKVVFYL